MDLNWDYRAEGNSNLIIFQSSGKNHIVYRLLKRQCKKNNKKFKVDYGNLEQRLHNGLDYCKYIFAPWMGPFLTTGHVVPLRDGFASQTKERVESHRPASRTSKEIDEEFPFAVTLPDFCFIPNPIATNSSPTFCIEIKPKWGYIPTSTHITQDIKLSVCRFCMHQYLKVSTGKWERRSGYCPIDLFSGNPDRMNHALRMLLKEPQNNLRLFKDGQCIYSDVIPKNTNELEEAFSYTSNNKNSSPSCSLEYFTKLVTKCLLLTHTSKASKSDESWDYRSQVCLNSVQHPKHKNGVNCIQPANKNGIHILSNEMVKEDNATGSSNGIKECLPEGCVLQRILKAQVLDDLDIEGLYPYYQRLEEHFAQNPTAREGSGVDGGYSENWFKQWCSTASSCNGNSHKSRTNMPTDKERLQTAVTKVKEFLVSRSAKDCSILVTVQLLTESSTRKWNEDKCQVERCLPENDFICEQNGHVYQCSVNVIDLDPKPFDKIPYYLTEDTKVVESYLSTRSDKSA